MLKWVRLRPNAVLSKWRVLVNNLFAYAQGRIPVPLWKWEVGQGQHEIKSQIICKCVIALQLVLSNLFLFPTSLRRGDNVKTFFQLSSSNSERSLNTALVRGLERVVYELPPRNTHINLQRDLLRLTSWWRVLPISEKTPRLRSSFDGAPPNVGLALGSSVKWCFLFRAKEEIFTNEKSIGHSNPLRVVQTCTSSSAK